MKKFISILFILILVTLVYSAALATDWLQQYADNEIGVIKISADVLYEYGSSYEGQTVVTAFNVKEKGSDCLKCETENNDTMSFSIVAYFDESEISGIKEGQSVIVVGTVDEFSSFGLFGSDKTVNLKDCHLITEGITAQEIDSLKDEQTQISQNNVETQAQAEAQAAADAQQVYIDSCESVEYKDVERNPNQYKGKKIKVMGSVEQVSEGWFNSVTMRIDEGDSRMWYVTYSRTDDNEPRILEGDNLTFYGECEGVETYTNLLGERVTIPALDAKMYR